MVDIDDANLAPVLGDSGGAQESLPFPPFAADRSENRATKVIAARLNGHGSLPLSYPQERLWFLDRLGLADVAYNVPLALRLFGVVDEMALERSFAELVCRHQSLRTRFGSEDGAPYQLIDPPGHFELRRGDLSGVADPLERERQLREHMRREELHKFDLSKGPLLRAVLLALTTREHALLVTVHHIIADGWSLGVLVTELGALYGAFSGGHASPLSELPMQYADYALSQRQAMQGEMLQTQLAYWKGRLRGAPQRLELPLDRPRPALESFRGARVKFEVPANRLNALRQLGRREKATLFMVVLTAFQVLLSRWSGERDIVVGAPISGRRSHATEGLIGSFVNMLALRTHVDERLTFRQLLERVKETTLGAYTHQDLPFERLVMELRPERDLSRQPIFQVALAFQSVPKELLDLPGLACVPMDSEEVSSPFDLTLFFREQGDRLCGEFHYASDLFEPSTIERMARHFEVLLKGIVESPADRVEQLPLLSEDERAQLLVEWNRTRAPYPSERCIHELFEEQAQRTPAAVAVVYGEERLTYGELHALARDTAARLQEEGVGRNDLVGICIEKCVEQAIAVLGVLMSGAAYLPVDPSWPAARREEILAAGRVRVVLGAVGAGAGSPAGLKAIEVDARRQGPYRAPVESGVTAKDIAYVIFTSGSTGKPKGVTIEHRSVVNTVVDINRRFAVSASDRVLSLSALTFDLSVYDVLGVLAVGGGVVLPEEAERVDPGRWVELVSRHGVTVWNTVPMLFQLFVEQLEGGGREPECGALRVALLSGDWIPVQLPSRARSQLPAIELHSLGGATEASIWSVTYPIGEVPATWTSVPYGKPLSNQGCLVLDEGLRLCPVGVAGDLYLTGEGLAQGYWGDEEQTARSFFEHPTLGMRVYRTGDRARYLRDGNLEFLGRRDTQVKIRGFRIELGEIETRLVLHEAVQAAAVVVLGEERDKLLSAYVVPVEQAVAEVRARSDELIEKLRAHLAGQLPSYMVPSFVTVMSALPLTANGKVDRKALPAPDASARQAEYEEPRGEVETALAEIWQELLQVERVGRHDNFFELGGHSLLAVQLIARLMRRGLQTDVQSLFSTSTLWQLAEQVGRPSVAAEVPENLIPAGCDRITPEMLSLVDLEQAEIDQIVERVPGGAGNVQDIYPLVPLQKGILFHHLLSEERDAYVLSSMLAFDSREQLNRFIAAQQAVIDRHDILRTAVMWEGLREPVQVVWREARLPVEEVTLEGVDAALQLRERLAPRHYRLDVKHAPLQKAFIAFDREQNRWLLLLLSHHLTTDHTTLEIIFDEVRAYLLGEEARLGTPVAFRNFVARARWEVNEKENEQFFREMLGDIEEPTAPFGCLDVRGDGAEIAEGQRPVDEGLSRRLRTCARAAGVSVASLCHLAWGQVLSRLTGREEVVFGTVLIGRLHGGDGAEQGMGLFINTLPLRLSIAEESVEQALRGTHERLGRLLGHEYASLALAQSCSGVPASLPLFTTLLNYRYSRAPGGGAEQEPRRPLAGISLVSVDERTNYPLTLSVDDYGEGLRLTVHVQGDIDPGRICGLVHAALAQLVESLEKAPRTSIRAVDVLPDEERHTLLVEWNRTEAEYPSERCIHELFEEQVEKTPEAVAVVYEDTSLTYRELNEQANRLAHYLRDQRVVPDARVGICVERGLSMVVGLLGILKAGGAYVPLDPSYPAARLRYLLGDSEPVLLLVDGAGRAALAAEALAMPVTDLHADASRWAGLSSDNPPAAQVGLCSGHLAYVIYTSGSTGQPKGVAIEHRNTVNLICWARSAMTPQEFSQTLHSTSLNFDLAVYECFVPLSTGAGIRVAQNALALLGEPPGVTLINTVPSAIKGILDSATIPETTRLVNVAGEVLKKELVDAIFARSSVDRVCNLYGPSETTTYSSWVSMSRVGGFDASIGHPIANTQIYILDRSMRPVPIGVEGEIYIGGAGVARGYLNRPELTAERFSSNPFSADVHARLYRTGDLGRFRTDGNIEFLGRNDQQVKIRGYRIELGEIEAKLAELAQIEEAVVLAREDEPGEKRLVAYYTTRMEGDARDTASLRAQLGQLLPSYMIPAAYVQLERLPLTPNGKLDRKALPAPEGSAYGRREHEAPQGEVETALAEIWQELLQVERVGRHDNFFELGGHSLLAVQLIARLMRRGLQTNVQSLFSTSTLWQLAEQVGCPSVAAEVPENLIPAGCDRITPEMLSLVDLEQAEIDQIAERVPGGAGNVQDIYPLAPLQQGILFHHLMNERVDAYVLPSLLAFDTRERLDRFLSALQAVIDRHDILRTAVMWEGLREPVQVVWREARLPVEEVTLEGVDAALQLRERLAPRHYRLDVKHAPLQKAFIAFDREQNRWLLLLLSHHLTTDHTTLEIIFDEVRAYLLGEEERLSAVVPFRNFVAEARLGVSAQEHEQFFRGLLGDVEEPTAPFELMDVRGNGAEIAEVRLRLDAELSRRIRACARAAGVSAASVCHLAWGQVLSRLTGREEVVFGTVLFGRLHGGEGAEQGIGLYINTLPLRLSIAEESVRQALRGTHERLGQLLEHEHASLALAQRCSGVPASLPLFTTLLNYRYSRGPDIAQHEQLRRAWVGISLLSGEERTNYPLTLSVDDFGEGFGLTAQVQAAIEPGRICELMRTALAQLAEALDHSPGTQVRGVDVLPEEERKQLLVEWNRTEAPYPSERCIHELFEEQAQRTPEVVAVVYEDTSLTYRQLNEQANRLAHYLIERGVEPDARVGICVERGLPMVVGLLGILKAGGAYVPLDPSYPAARLRYLLGDSEPVLLLVDAAGVAALSEELPTVPVIDVQADASRWNGRSTANPLGAQRGLHSRRLAYVIYTSGSTGEPKGALNEHRALVNRLTWMQDQYRLDGEDRVLQKTPFGFDVSVWEFFWTLSNGARLILARPEGHRDPEYLRQVIEGQGVTRLHFVPSMLQSFLERHPAGSCGSVKQVVCSGEELSAGLLQRCVKALPQAQVSNLYGPTEAAIDVSYWECRPGEELSCVPIGRPIANTQLYILDGQMKPVPIGVAGEIYIGGAGVGRGYWKRPELTAERFVKDPFSANRESRLYRTGDIGRYRLDGNIEYLARNDHQVKIRGYRIELGEIEARLKDREEIKDVVVLAREDTPGEKRLVAYYTTRMEGDVSETESLRVHLEQVLPSYMIPAAYVPLERLPLTPNGKLDRKALPAPEAGAYRHREYEAPQGEIETALAEIWGKLLLVERVGRHDNFFELGGHSLLAVRLQRELYVLGYEVSLTSIFEHPTVVKLERHIAQLERHMLQRPGNRGASENLVVLRDEGSETPLFLIHEGEGNVACLVHLAKRLDSEIPVYGLELTDPRYAASIESLAAYHIENMREIQPKGPYRIAGYSFGGLVAYEMARQLLGAGQAVTFIGLLDTVPPDETFDPMERLERMAEWRLKAKDDKAHLLKMDIGQACATAHHSYRVEPLYVPITLFEATQSVVATEGEDVRKERSRTWTAWLGSDLHIYQVSGNHLSMVKEPDVDSLAVAVSTAVRQSTG